VQSRVSFGARALPAHVSLGFGFVESSVENKENGFSSDFQPRFIDA